MPPPLYRLWRPRSLFPSPLSSYVSISVSTPHCRSPPLHRLRRAHHAAPHARLRSQVSYCTSILLYCCTTIPLYHCPTIPLSHYAAILYHYTTIKFYHSPYRRYIVGFDGPAALPDGLTAEQLAALRDQVSDSTNILLYYYTTIPILLHYSTNTAILY